MMTTMTSMQRFLTTVGHQEPDRVPLFLLLTLHGARELGISIKEYFSVPENVAEGQLRLRAKFRHDCAYSFFYAAIEVEAWGGEVVYFEDGPPNSGEPIIHDWEQILDLEPPRVRESACLARVLDATGQLKSRLGDDIPIIGVAMSPFSLPVMQIGFARYINLMYERPDLLHHLMDVNEAFCVEWANAQVEAGATAICYFDPVSSVSMVPPELYVGVGKPVAKRTLTRIKAPTVTHFASGTCLKIVDDVAETGTAGVGVSASEDLAALKAACRGKLALLGNLNGIEMRHWTPEQAEAKVKEAVAIAGPGGGFILSDNHGEIPFQVPDDVLAAVSEAAHKWGRYPLEWARAEKI